jgi:hypothetical protein
MSSKVAKIFLFILYENNTLEFVDNSFKNSNTKENNIILCKWPLILWSFTAASSTYQIDPIFN